MSSFLLKKLVKSHGPVENQDLPPRSCSKKSIFPNKRELFRNSAKKSPGFTVFTPLFLSELGRPKA